MRICHVTSSYSRFNEDGNARFVRSIVEAQAALGHEVHVIAPYSIEVRSYPSPVHLHWFHYVWPARWGHMGHAQSLANDRQLTASAYWQAPSYFVAQSLATTRVVQRYQIDIIHAHWIVPNGPSAAFISRWTHLPLYISLHGSDVYLATRKAWLRRMAGWAFQRAKGVTACSPDLAEGAIGLGARPDHVHVIPYGADPMRFKRESDAVGMRQWLNLKSDAYVILAAGRLVGKKGFSQLVRAMPKVLDVVPDARLVIVGEGPERNVLEGLIEALGLTGKVLLPGAVGWTQMPRYLAMADVFVMPSIQDVTGNVDGLPNVILEAMAAGCPVIATRIAGIPLAVQDNETGFLIDQADPQLLSEAIVRLFSAPEKRLAMGCAARRRIEIELNWSSLARRFDLMYQSKA